MLATTTTVEPHQPTTNGKNGEHGKSNGSAKKGGSFLSRAKNSTINLASLATVTQRFYCSASVGNLWSSHQGEATRRELAELSGDSPAVKQLDYVVGEPFDTPICDDCQNEQQRQQQQLLSPEQQPTTITNHKTSAWTNPQNLATWIDNEFNSFLNDLEAKRQLCDKTKHHKHAKCSKRKWMSSGGNARRNSPSAHST